MNNQLQAAQLQKSAQEEREQAEKSRALILAQLEVAKGRIEQLEAKVRELSAEVARASGAHTSLSCQGVHATLTSPRSRFW